MKQNIFPVSGTLALFLMAAPDSGVFAQNQSSRGTLSGQYRPVNANWYNSPYAAGYAPAAMTDASPRYGAVAPAQDSRIARDIRQLHSSTELNRHRLDRLEKKVNNLTGVSAPASNAITPPAAVRAPSGNLQAYVVQPGDTLTRIARRHRTNPLWIQQANQIPDPNRLRAGQKILIPLGGGGNVVTAPPAQSQPPSQPVVATTPPPTAPVVAQPGQPTSSHTVRDRETLYSIARAYGTSASRLQQMNNISDPRLLREGQKLVVPGAGSSVPSVPPPAASASKPASVTGSLPSKGFDERKYRFYTYIVDRGDTLDSLARNYGIARKSIEQANNLSSADRLRIGQELMIPIPKESSLIH